MNLLYDAMQGSIDEELHTKHLLLRPYQEGDENDFMRLIHENATALNPAFGGRQVRVQVLDDARVQVKQLRTDWENHKVFEFGVWLQENDTYIGDIALKDFDHRIPKAEIGLYFKDWPHTRTYAQEALWAVVKFAFQILGLNKVYIRCTTSNIFYGELAEACGFQKEGVLRSDYRGVDSDELLDLNYYGMTHQDFDQAAQLLNKVDSAVTATKG